MVAGRRSWRWIVGCVLLGTGIVLIWAVYPRERLLLPQATQVANVSHWWTEEAPICPYEWLSDSTVFSHSGWWRLLDPFTFDITSQQKTSLTKLNRWLQADADMG